MSRLLLVEDSENAAIVGDLGRGLAMLARIGARIARGFVVPCGVNLRDGLSNEILRWFDRLETKSVSLRSSNEEAAAELETLHDIGRRQLLEAIEYLQNNARRRGGAAAIVAQKSLNAEIVGSIYSENPHVNEGGEMIIEASLWSSKTVLRRVASEKDRVLIKKSTGALLLEDEDLEEMCLDPRQIQEIYTITRKIERRARKAVRVDWAYDAGRLFIVRLQALKKEVYEKQ